MLPKIPEDAIEFIRAAFAQANLKATTTLARQPSMHEEGLDFQLIAALEEYGPRLLPGSGAAVEIEAHWLGGRRHFEFEDRRWEVADIAVQVSVRRLGVLLARKIALLQSKRLYAEEIAVHELERADYVFGIGRLFDRVESIPTLTTPRAFEFTQDSLYEAMVAGSGQVRMISSYENEHGIPVYYNLYNPPNIPYRGYVPPSPQDVSDAMNLNVGCRIMSAIDVHAVLNKLSSGRPPKFCEVVTSLPTTPHDAFRSHGWRLESFIADELLRCREGRLFEDNQDTNLRRLLYGRSAPIAAGILITIDLPGSD